MSESVIEQPKERCAAEVQLASEFPDLYGFYSGHEAVRPRRAENWERILRVARNCQPILEDLRARGLDLVRVDQYTAPGIDLTSLYETLVEWLPRIQDPLTLTICLSRLGEPGARVLVKKNRELLLRLTGKWNDKLPENDRERTLCTLAQHAMKVALERDVPQVLKWANDSSLPTEARGYYVLGLKRFAGKPGLARDALATMVANPEVGAAAVWALAGALKAEALPLLQELRQASPIDLVRKAAAAASKKLEARLRRVTLANASPTELPQGYASTSIEFDTDYVPEFLSIVERELKGQLQPGVGEQVALSANQLKRGRRRFHIVRLTLSDGAVSQLGFGLYAEDEDAIVVEVHFDANLRDAIDTALDRLMAFGAGRAVTCSKLGGQRA